jgi:hypothetical protein
MSVLKVLLVLLDQVYITYNHHILMDHIMMEIDGMIHLPVTSLYGSLMIMDLNGLCLLREVKGIKEYRVLPGLKGIKEVKDMDFRDFRVIKVIKGLKGYKEVKDSKEVKDMDFRDFKVIKVIKDLKGYKGYKEVKDMDFKDFKVIKEIKDLKGYKEVKDLKVFKVLLVWTIFPMLTNLLDWLLELLYQTHQLIQLD